MRVDLSKHSFENRYRFKSCPHKRITGNGELVPSWLPGIPFKGIRGFFDLLKHIGPFIAGFFKR